MSQQFGNIYDTKFYQNDIYSYICDIDNDIYRIFDGDKILATFNKIYFSALFIDLIEERKLKLNKINESSI